MSRHEDSFPSCQGLCQLASACPHLPTDFAASRRLCLSGYMCQAWSYFELEDNIVGVLRVAVVDVVVAVVVAVVVVASAAVAFAVAFASAAAEGEPVPSRRTGSYSSGYCVELSLDSASFQGPSFDSAS